MSGAAEAYAMAMVEAHRVRECAQADAVAAVYRLRAAVWAELSIETKAAMAANDIAHITQAPYADLDAINAGGGCLLRRCTQALSLLGHTVWEADNLEQAGATSPANEEEVRP